MSSGNVCLTTFISPIRAPPSHSVLHISSALISDFEYRMKSAGAHILSSPWDVWKHTSSENFVGFTRQQTLHETYTAGDFLEIRPGPLSLFSVVAHNANCADLVWSIQSERHSVSRFARRSSRVVCRIPNNRYLQEIYFIGIDASVSHLVRDLSGAQSYWY